MLRRRALVTSLTLAFLLLVSPAWAGLDEGVAASLRGDYAAALREFRPLARQGDVRAQYHLGVMYEYGHGVPKDYAEAMKWYRLAAAQGDVGAQNNLGVMYENGHGVPKDYVQAHMWFNLAASRFSPGKDRDILVKSRDLVARKMTPPVGRGPAPRARAETDGWQVDESVPIREVLGM